MPVSTRLLSVPQCGFGSGPGGQERKFPGDGRAITRTLVTPLRYRDRHHLATLSGTLCATMRLPLPTETRRDHATLGHRSATVTDVNSACGTPCGYSLCNNDTQARAVTRFTVGLDFHACHPFHCWSRKQRGGNRRCRDGYPGLHTFPGMHVAVPTDPGDDHGFPGTPLTSTLTDVLR